MGKPNILTLGDTASESSAARLRSTNSRSSGPATVGTSALVAKEEGLSTQVESEYTLTDRDRNIHLMDKQKILIVEDDLDLARGLAIRLRASNYETRQASDGGSAFLMAQEENPNLVILDLGLPDEDGFSVLEKLRANDSLLNVPVIVLTARDPLVNEQRTLQAGAFAFMQKPADNNQLLAAIRSALSDTRTKGDLN